MGNSVFILLSTLSVVFACKKIMGYNTRYCISKPHYLSITGPLHSKPENFPKVEQSYKIPEYIYSNIFRHNIQYKKRN